MSKQIQTVTDSQIQALRTEAAQAGDFRMVAIADRALGGSSHASMTVQAARRECARVIAEAAAQR